MATESAALARQFEEDGFIVLPNLIGRAEAQALKAEIQRVLAEVAREAGARGEQPAFQKSGVYVGLSIRSPMCREFNRDPRLLDAVEAAIGPNILFWSDKVVFKTDETDFGTPWHQDWPYWKGIHKVTLWIALDDIDESNGCLQLVQGSHRAPVEHHAGSSAQVFGHQLDPAAVDPTRIVTVPAPAGTGTLFHDLTLHASHPNRAHTDRYALAISYKDAAAEDLEYPAMTAAAVVRGHGRA
jgi:ectoine hydroxylase-related dioxygenase (phytanoyl-CoA dioxygenase family)